MALKQIIIFALAFSLRFYQLLFLEFKNDQFHAMQLGNETRKACFLIAHGMGSGIGINNPPLFLWFMGIVTFFTTNPLFIAGFFMFLNLAALLLAMRYFYLSLPKTYAILSSAILAFSPAFTIYSNNIWAQCLLPLVMVLFHINLYKFIKGNNTDLFISLGILAAIAAQLHMSGFFVFPALILLAFLYRKKIKLRIFGLTCLLIFIIFAPYLYHIFLEKEGDKFIAYVKFFKNHFYWKIFREHLRMASFDFFRHYFRYDFGQVLNRSAGLFAFALYPLTCVLMLFFAFSFLYYLGWLIKGKRLFNIDSEELKKNPLPFQIAGFLILTVTLGYFILKVHTPPHYLIVLFPSYSLLTGFFAYKAWRFFWVRITVYSSIAATAILVFFLFIFLKDAGGHPYEYGPSYRIILEWKKAVWSKTQGDYCPSLSIQSNGKGKCDTEAIMAVIADSNKCNNAKGVTPIKLFYYWNPDLMRYVYSIERQQK